MEKLVIGACSNIDTLKVGNKISRPFLNGASIYSGYTAELIAPTRINMYRRGTEKFRNN